jgi:hypothetical protein
MPQLFRKVENLPKHDRKATMRTTASEYQKREEMSPICPILLNATKTDGKQ